MKEILMHLIKFLTISADKLLPLGVQVEEESPYPTLEEAASMAAQSSHFTSSTTTTSMDYEMDDAMPSTSNANNFCEDASSTITQKKNIKQYIGHTIPKDFLMKSGLLNSSNSESDSAEPLYKVNGDGSVIGFVHSVIRHFYYYNFRSLQMPRKKSTMR